MWFSEEAGGKVGRIDLLAKDDDPGKIVEFPVPLTQSNAILAGLAFDADGALWVQQYVSPPAQGDPVAADYIVRLGPALQTARMGDMTGVSVDYFKAPSKGTVMHRITQGPDGNIWFTELGINRVGRLIPRG
jgi:virginiamycin B lyase